MRPVYVLTGPRAAEGMAGVCGAGRHTAGAGGRGRGQA